VEEFEVPGVICRGRRWRPAQEGPLSHLVLVRVSDIRRDDLALQIAVLSDQLSPAAEEISESLEPVKLSQYHDHRLLRGQGDIRRVGWWEESQVNRSAF
jgi:hypothetical protein